MSVPQRSAAAHPPGAARRLIVHYSEITLKGRNRDEFEDHLITNMRRRLSPLGIHWRIRRQRGRIYLDPPPVPEVALEHVAKALCEVTGIDNVIDALWLRPEELGADPANPDRGIIERALVALADAHYREDASFAVRVNRGDKTLAMNSQQIGIWLGAALQQQTRWQRVQLNRPDQTFGLDVHPDGWYLYADKYKGIGGLPVDSAGRVLCLLSGGIDSPVAGYLMAKRGCTVDFLHMTASYLQQSQLEQSSVVEAAARVSVYTLRSRLYLVPYTRFDLALAGEPTGFELVMFRRFMARLAERLAQQINAQALVTGDNLGQVASQTLENLATTARAVDILLLQPLMTYNKQEIIELARRIGTYEISIKPYKDCCALLSQRPKTRSRAERVAELERALLPDYAALLEATLAEVECVEFECGTMTRRVPLTRQPGHSAAPTQ